MKFETIPEIDEWTKEHQKTCISKATAGEQFTYEFIPTGIVECQTCKCMICGEKKTAYN